MPPAMDPHAAPQELPGSKASFLVFLARAKSLLSFQSLSKIKVESFNFPTSSPTQSPCSAVVSLPCFSATNFLNLTNTCGQKPCFRATSLNHLQPTLAAEVPLIEWELDEGEGNFSHHLKRETCCPTFFNREKLRFKDWYVPLTSTTSGSSILWGKCHGAIAHIKCSESACFVNSTNCLCQLPWYQRTNSCSLLKSSSLGKADLIGNYRNIKPHITSQMIPFLFVQKTYCLQKYPTLQTAPKTNHCQSS